MDDQSFQLTEAPKKGRRAIIISAVAVLFMIFAIMVVIFWPLVFHKDRSGSPSSVPAAENTSSNDSLIGVPPLDPGQDRPLTVEEKKHYGFIVSDDIWLKTSSPTDDSKPAMSFYNKTKPVYTTPPTPILLNDGD